MNLQINPEVKADYTIVLKDALRAEHRKMKEINDLRVESCKTLEICDCGIICLCGDRSCYNKLEVCPLLPASYNKAKLFPERPGIFRKIFESKKGIQYKEKWRKGHKRSHKKGQRGTSRNSTNSAEATRA